MVHTMTFAQLIFENGANWRYATGTSIADPALWYRAPSGRTHIIVSELEISLMRANANVDHIHSFEDVRRGLGDKALTLSVMVEWLRVKEAVDVIYVPHDFPAGTFMRLKEAGLPVEVNKDELFFPQRAIKTLKEIEALTVAQRANEQCFHHAFKVLRESDIGRDDVLFWKGQTLTAEILRAEMNKKAVEHGCEEFHGGPIVACGAQGAMPHERGHGPLRAHEFIVMDCFPRHANGYWGDLTRTVLKGKATPWHTDVYAAVLAAHDAGLGLIKAGVNGKDIHLRVAATLAEAGFKTGTDDKGRPYGFFHGTGHGVGLELHEPGPRMLSTVASELKAGYVTSVEPGLYYPAPVSGGGIGGCRIEDVVTVTDTGYHNLTSFPKDKWVID